LVAHIHILESCGEGHAEEEELDLGGRQISLQPENINSVAESRETSEVKPEKPTRFPIMS
jgi:hypothetical protein